MIAPVADVPFAAPLEGSDNSPAKVLWAAFMFELAPWVKDAACRDHDTAFFFSPKGGVWQKEQMARIIAVCEECPVREECLDAALERNEKHGVWGGHTVMERRRIARKRRLG